MRTVSLTVLRIILTAWVGAAALFVVTGVREITSQQFTSEVRDLLVSIRFPAYYLFGFTAVGIAFVTALAARKHPAVTPLRMHLCLGLLIAAFALMLVDYFWIYTPLVEMITPPGQARPAQFIDYHNASKWINAADLSLCLIAALLACWPNRQATPIQKID